MLSMVNDHMSPSQCKYYDLLTHNDSAALISVPHESEHIRQRGYVSGLVGSSVCLSLSLSDYLIRNYWICIKL